MKMVIMRMLNRTTMFFMLKQDIGMIGYETFALKTSRTSIQMLRLIVLFLNRNPNFLSSNLK